MPFGCKPLPSVVLGALFEVLDGQQLPPVLFGPLPNVIAFALELIPEALQVILISLIKFVQDLVAFVLVVESLRQAFHLLFVFESALQFLVHRVLREPAGSLRRWIRSRRATCRRVGLLAGLRGG